MFIISIVVLLDLGYCSPGSGVVGDYGSYKDLTDGLKSSANGGGHHLQKDYVKNHDNLEMYKGYINGYDNRDGHADNIKNQWDYEEYVYDKNYYKDFDVREYDYDQKCDINVKDCKDGRHCYDKASDRSGYDDCKNQYGDEGRYYDIDDRYSSDRYRVDDYDDGYDKEWYGNHNNSDYYNEYRNGNYKDKNDYDKDCRDNTENREDFIECQWYYRKCYREYGNKYFYNEQDWRNERNCYIADKNVVGLGRKNVEDQIVRPCALDDRQCIRKYLAMNSKCKPTYGPIPDPLYLKRSTVYFPLANLTVIRTRLRITGLASMKISKFYVNKNTKNLVIALDFEKLNQTSPRVYFRYQRTAKESVVLYDYASDEYQSGTFTVVIPMIPDLRLELAEVHADINDLVPALIVGPKAFESKGEDIDDLWRHGQRSPANTND